MKTVTKLFTGLLLASSLTLGCSTAAKAAEVSFHYTETTTTTDANGNTTTTTTTNENGKTETKTEKTFKKDTTFDNETDVTFKELYMKWSKNKEYNVELLGGDTLESGYELTFKETKYQEALKSLDFKIVTTDGQSVEIKGLDVSNIKDLNKVTFQFTQEGNTVYVQVLK